MASSKRSLIKRRSFLRTAAGRDGLQRCAASTWWRGRLRPPPSETVNLGVIGTGGQGIVNIKRILGEPGLRIPALVRRKQAVRLQRVLLRRRGWVSNRHGTWSRKRAESVRRAITSTRKCWRRRISTPFFSPRRIIRTALIALAVLAAGKHLYCEKPLCRTVSEVRAVTEVGRGRAKVATQMGNHGHSGRGYPADVRVDMGWGNRGRSGGSRVVDGRGEDVVFVHGAAGGKRRRSRRVSTGNRWLKPVPYRAVPPGVRAGALAFVVAVRVGYDRRLRVPPPGPSVLGAEIGPRPSRSASSRGRSTGFRRRSVRLRRRFVSSFRRGPGCRRCAWCGYEGGYLPERPKGTG